METMSKFSEIISSSSLNFENTVITTHDDIKECIKYRETDIVKPQLHLGQLKLVLSEIQFLTGQNTPGYVIYAGSAPGVKTSVLLECFPTLKFILIDPNAHHIVFKHGDQYDPQYQDHILYLSICGTDNKCLGNSLGKKSLRPQIVNIWGESGLTKQVRPNKSISKTTNFLDAIKTTHHNIYILEEFFTTELALQLKECVRPITPQLYFISDVRTNIGRDFPSDIDIIWNCAQQYNWVEALTPTAFMLKFRCPFKYDCDSIFEDYSNAEYMHADIEKCSIPFMENVKKGIFEYISGEVRIQAFAKHTSTESRLVGCGTSLSTKIYDIYEYEDKFFYYNSIVRPFKAHNHPTNYVLGVDRCADCALMTKIISEYNIQKPSHIQPLCLETILTILGRSLRYNLHGVLYESPITETMSRDQKINALCARQKKLTYLHQLRELYPINKLLPEYSSSEQNVVTRIYGNHPNIICPPRGKHYFIYSKEFDAILSEYIEICINNQYTATTAYCKRKFILTDYLYTIDKPVLLYVPSLSPELEYCLMELLATRKRKVVLATYRTDYIIPRKSIQVYVSTKKYLVEGSKLPLGETKTLYLFGRNMVV